MTGTYESAISNRIPYDLDGGTWFNLSGPVQYANSYAQATNGEGFPWTWAFYGGGTSQQNVLIFPYLIDIAGLYVSGGSLSVTSWSSDTTNGIDGTWTAASVTVYGGGAVSARNDIFPVSWTNVRAIRFLWTGGSLRYGYVTAVHVYGRPSTGENPSRLEIWHPTLNQRVAGDHFDWGDAQRTSTADIQFRVKNLSDTLIANNITISFDALTDSSPSFRDMHLLSTGGSFASTASISSLNPNGISNVITVRRTIPSNAQLSLWSARLKAVAASWT